MVILLLKGKTLDLNLLKPSPTLELVMIISEHWKICQNDSSRVEIIWLLTLWFNDDLGDPFVPCTLGWKRYTISAWPELNI